MLILFFIGLLGASSLDDWNFDGLAKDTYYEVMYYSYTYRFNFRKALPTDTSRNCTQTNCVVEELASGSYYCYCYGNISTEVVDIWPDDTAVNFTYKSQTPGGTNTNGHFQLFCKMEGTMNFSANYSGWDVYVNISAPQGCKGYGMDKKSKKGSGGGIGFGGVFFIILLSVVVLYFLIGVPISYFVLHKTGLELFIPGYPLIIGFFQCVVAGVKFIFNSIKGLATGKSVGGDSAYSKI